MILLYIVPSVKQDLWRKFDKVILFFYSLLLLLPADKLNSSHLSQPHHPNSLFCQVNTLVCVTTHINLQTIYMTLWLCKLEKISSSRVSYLGFTVTFHSTSQSYIITKLLLPSAYRRYFISWGPLPCFKVITAKEPGYEWEVTARRIALGMYPQDGLYQPQCVCVCIEAGHWPFYSSHTIQPSSQPCPSCGAQGLCGSSAHLADNDGPGDLTCTRRQLRSWQCCSEANK